MVLVVHYTWYFNLHNSITSDLLQMIFVGFIMPWHPPLHLHHLCAIMEGTFYFDNIIVSPIKETKSIFVIFLFKGIIEVNLLSSASNNHFIAFQFGTFLLVPTTVTLILFNIFNAPLTINRDSFQ